jgi:hypothetical protein
LAALEKELKKYVTAPGDKSQGGRDAATAAGSQEELTLASVHGCDLDG